MRQVFPKVLTNVSYGGGTQYIGVLDGFSISSDSITYGRDSTRAPCRIGGVFSLLTVYSQTPVPATTTLTLFVNGVATSLTVTITASDTLVSDQTHTVTINPTDDITYQILTTQQAFPGFSLGVSIAFDGAENLYGLTSKPTFWSGGGIGGAFGNGVTETWTAVGVPVESVTYSITATAGTVTGLIIRSYLAAADTGTWTAYLMVDRVLQDGTGATVNTALVLADPAKIASNSFSVPVALGQHVDIVVARAGGAPPFSLAQIGLGVTFTPTLAGAFMSCGGSNDSISNSVTGWKWTHSLQLATPEGVNVAPVGPSGLGILGLYVERTNIGTLVPGPPGVGKSYVHTLRKSYTSTPVAVTIADLNFTGSIFGPRIDFGPTDVMTLEIDPVGTPANSGFYWGLLLTLVSPTPPPVGPPGCPVALGVGTGGGPVCAVPWTVEST